MPSISNLFATTASLIVLVALALQNFEHRSGIGLGSGWGATYDCSQGWPIAFRRHRVEEFDGNTFMAPSRMSSDFTIIPLGVVVNLGVAASIALGAFAVCRRQITLTNMLIFLTYATLVTYTYTNDASNLSWHLGSFAWYTDLPIAFGVTCTCTSLTSSFFGDRAGT